MDIREAQLSSQEGRENHYLSLNSREALLPSQKAERAIIRASIAVSQKAESTFNRASWAARITLVDSISLFCGCVATRKKYFQ